MGGIVHEATAPLIAKISELEKQIQERPSLEEVAKQAAALIPTPKDGAPGRDADPADKEEIKRLVVDVVAQLPKPQDGKSVDPEQVNQAVAELVAKALDAFPIPRDGKDYEPEVLRRAVVEEVAALPKPADGKSVTSEDLRPLVAEEVAKAVAGIPKAADGAPGRDGRDGQPGLPGRDGQDGKDGANGEAGKDGADGLGFDDMSVEYDGERTVSLLFARGGVVKRFDLSLPIAIDRGIYRSEEKHARGDAVSYGGSLWIAQKDAPEGKPGEGSDWRLAVKKGRDGKDGKDGDRGERGIEGKAGRDMTQMAFDGSKY